MFGGMAKWVAEIDDAARIPEFVHRAFPPRPPAGPGRWCWRCPRTCCSSGAASPTAGRAEPVEAAPAPERWPSCGGCSPAAERPFVMLGGGGWNAAGVAALAALPRATTCRRPALPPPGPARQRRIAATSAMSASAPTRSSPRGSRPATCARHRQPARRDHQPGLHAARHAAARARPWSTSTTSPRSSAASTRPTSRSRPASTRFAAAAARAAAAAAPAVGRGDARRARRGARLARRRRAIPGRADGRDRRLAARARCRPTRSSPTAPATTRLGHRHFAIAASAPSSRRPRARWATACRRRSRPSACIPSARSSASPATAAS